MIVVYTITNNFAEKIQPSIKSLKEHNADVFVVVVAEMNNVPNADRVINVSGQTYIKQNSPNYNTPFSHMCLMKVLYPVLMEYDKVIHMDADTIIVDSLAPIWEIDLTGKWFAAADEKRGEYHPFGAQYFNAGVMVMNLKQMREDNAAQIMADHLNNHRETYVEQDALNKFGKGKIVEFDTRYNESFATDFSNNPAVIHYAGIKHWWTNRNFPRAEWLDRYR